MTRRCNKFYASLTASYERDVSYETPYLSLIYDSGPNPAAIPSPSLHSPPPPPASVQPAGKTHSEGPFSDAVKTLIIYKTRSEALQRKETIR